MATTRTSSRTTRTRGADAPLSTAQKPSAAATGLAVTEDDEKLVGRTVTIDRDRQELYDFWRDFRNLPLFMENIERVDVMDAHRSHWVVRAPADSKVEWDSIIVEDIPGRVIEWRSADGADVTNSGRIEFLDSTNDRGTIVAVTIAWDPPAGALGNLFAKIFRREPKVQARHELRRFKQLMETGELPTSQTPASAD
jgi:uncharacterized membrane protein